MAENPANDHPPAGDGRDPMTALEVSSLLDRIEGAWERIRRESTRLEPEP
jgi:hypothetical protein